MNILGLTPADQLGLGALIVAILSLIVSIGTAIKNASDNRKSRARAEEANSIANSANNLAQQANQFSHQANSLAEKANTLAAGDAETAMMESIRSAWEQVDRIRGELDQILHGRSKSKLSAEETRRIAGMENGLRFAIERVCDSYEAACGRYLDGKCDKERFRKLFFDSIRQLVQNDTETFKQVLKPGPASKYGAILKVYTEWHHLEK